MSSHTTHPPAETRGPNLRCEDCGCIKADDNFSRCQMCENKRPLRDRVLEVALRNRDVNGYNCDCHDEIADIFDHALPAPSTPAPTRDVVEKAIDLYGSECSACGYGHLNYRKERSTVAARAALLALYVPSPDASEAVAWAVQDGRGAWLAPDADEQSAREKAAWLNARHDQHGAHKPYTARPLYATPVPSATKGGEDTPRAQFWRAICAEIDHAYAKHGREPWGRHEFYAIMREEVDEVWDEIKRDTPTLDLLKEVVQVAAMCLRYSETGDRYRGEHPAIPQRASTPTGAPSE